MKHAIEIIAAFVRNVHLKRVMHNVDAEPRLNFWRIIHGNCHDVAVIDWCKLFGSDNADHQPVHWKNVVPDYLHDDFRERLFCSLGVTSDEWNDYWLEMKGWRDNQVAHFNEEYLRPENNRRYPHFDLALEAVYFYYQQILETMQANGQHHAYPRDIRQYCEQFTSQATEAAISAINATATMDETVR